MAKRLTTEESVRVSTIANNLAKKIIAGETLRLALPIANKTADIIRAQYKRIEEKYGEV